MKKWASVLAAASICIGCGGGQNDRSATPSSVQGVSYHEVTLPSGTTLRLRLQSAVESDKSRVEKPVRAALRDAIVINGATVLPIGTEVAGFVSDVQGRARVAFQFNSLYYAGDHYDVSTAPLSHRAEANGGGNVTTRLTAPLTILVQG